jgi:hypothetical protein
MKIRSAQHLPFRPVWWVWLPGRRFSEKWAGQLEVRSSDGSELLLEALLKRYRLAQE